MKKNLWVAGLVLLGVVSAGRLAIGEGTDNKRTCSPTNISYCKQGSTFLGGSYKMYTVRCSDGTRRSITAWDNRKKWCVGTDKDCTNDQLKAAKLACQSD